MRLFQYLTVFRLLTFSGLAVLLLSSSALHAQSSPGRSALGKMEKRNWLKAEQLLRKSLKKDTLNAEARYVYSLLYFRGDYPKYNLDSAYQYSLAALSDYQKSSPRQKEKLKRFPLDSAILVSLRKRIDSAAFERAKTINSVSSYQFFLDQFTFAIQRGMAVELRDEVAFVGALKVNTYHIFKDYMDHYPASHRKEEACRRYEKLLFEDKTRDGRLKSYENFLKEYPATNYRKEAEKNIFEIATASGEPVAFKKFMQSYPESFASKKADDILYHLLGDEQHSSDLKDSLQNVNALENGYWVPVMKNEKFGFMNQNGEEVMAPSFEVIYDEYKCGEIKTDYVITSEGVIGRNGKVIYKGLIEEVAELGLGFLSVQDSACFSIIHKSGFTLHSSCLEGAKIIANRFMAFKHNSKWGLSALNGKNLLMPEFDDIYSLDEIIVLVKSGKRLLKTQSQIASLADKISFSESMVFDEVLLIEPGTYLVKNGTLEGTLNARLEFIIPLDRQILNRTPYGYVTKKDEKYRVIGIANELAGQEFDEIRFYENWLTLENESGLQLFNIPAKRNVLSQLDSIWFSNHLAFALKEDTLTVFLSSGTQKKFPAQSNFRFIKAADRQLYFYTSERNKKNVYDASTGNRLFQLDFDEIEYFGHQLFMITRDGKKGLMSSDGNMVLPVEYSVIVLTQNDYASLFKDKKFGLYDLRKRELIKPMFERNVKPFRANIFIAFKEGYFGFVNTDSRPLSKFEFEDVLEWNDSTALVKKNFQWMIFNWRTDKTSFDGIRDYRMILNSIEERIILVHQENAYGVISSRYGRVVPSTFSDIINIGSDEEPLYFAEKNIEEAGIYVVIYYDKQGKLLRRQVFEKEEYDEIYCEDK